MFWAITYIEFGLSKSLSSREITATVGRDKPEFKKVK
jgi:hypothetical protein